MIPLVVFSVVLKIFINESVNSTFKNKLEYKFEYKLGRFNIWELVPDITEKFEWKSVYRDFRGRKILVG